MAKQLEAFAKEYAALLRDIDSAAVQLKDAQQRRAQHEQTLRDQTQALNRRVIALRETGSRGRAGGLEVYQYDDVVRRLQASLDDLLARAEADRQKNHALAVGAWAAVLKRAVGLEKELAAEIMLRQKQISSKTGLGNKSLADMGLLQADLRKKLAPRRAALQNGVQALGHNDPDYFSKRRAEALAALATGWTRVPAPTPSTTTAPVTNKTAPKTSQPIGWARTPTPPTTEVLPAGARLAARRAQILAAARERAAGQRALTSKPKKVTSVPESTTAGGTTTGGVTTPTPDPSPVDTASVESLLTEEIFKIAGRELSQHIETLHRSLLGARTAVLRQDSAGLAKAKTAGAASLEKLEALLQKYEQARKATGDKAILKLPIGKQMLAGLKAMQGARTKARAEARALAKLK